MSTATGTLHGGSLTRNGMHWVIIPAAIVAGVVMLTPPEVFNEITSISLLPTADAANTVADASGAASPSKESVFDLTVDPPVQGVADLSDGSPMGFKVGKPRRYHVDYKVFGSSNRAAYDVYVDGVEQIEGQPYYKVVTVLSGTPRDRTETMYYRASDKGVHRRFEIKDKTYETLWYPAPFQVGHTWSYDLGGLTHSGKYEALEEVEVNGEKLQCLRVALDGSCGRSTEWVCPGRGIVKCSQKSRLYSAEVTVDTTAPVPPRESVALND